MERIALEIRWPAIWECRGKEYSASEVDKVVEVRADAGCDVAGSLRAAGVYEGGRYEDVTVCGVKRKRDVPQRAMRGSMRVKRWRYAAGISVIFSVSL